MRLEIVSYNGNTLNSGGFKAIFPEDSSILGQAQPVVIERGLGAWPIMSGKRLGARQFEIVIIMTGTLATQLDQIKRWFDISDQAEYELLCQDPDNANRQWYVMATCVSIPELVGNTASVVLSVTDPIWRAKTTTTVTGSLASSGLHHDCTVLGNRRTFPTVTLVPTGAKPSGLIYRKFLAIYNRVNRKLVGYPLDLTGGGWSTTALVSGSKMRSDGEDITVAIDGQAWPRWIDSPNSASTKVWTYVDLDRPLEMSLSTSIAVSGAVTSIVVKSTAANQSVLQDLKAPGLLMIDSELFSFGGIDAGTYTITGVTRAERGSSMAAHSTGATVRWIQHEVWVSYGNLSATAPTQDDTAKPVFNLTTSTNTSWVYTQFQDSGLNRRGRWSKNILTGGKTGGKLYTKTGVDDEDPASAMGIAAESYEKNGTWQPGRVEAVWGIENLCGITTVTSNGKKYRSATGFFSGCRLEWGAPDAGGDTAYHTVWTEGSPASAASWTAWTQNSASLSGTRTAVRFHVIGGGASGNGYFTAFEVLGATLTLDSSTVPSLTGMATATEQAAYPLAATISNATSGKYFYLALSLKLNDSVVIDTESKTITVNGTVNGMGGFSIPEVRRDWLAMEPGLNEIRLDDAGMTGITFTVAWKDRSS